MIMQARQVNRLLKLFDSLLTFCAKDLEVPGVNARPGVPLDDDDADVIIGAVWGEAGDTSVIDRFVEANPDGLNRTDLREVATWKEGIYEHFGVVRDGANVYLTLVNHAFAVRGHDCEFDECLEFMPTYVQTLLLPFDGVITFGFVVDALVDELDLRERELLVKGLEDCKAARHIARTSRQFAQMAPTAREEMREYLARTDEAMDLLGLGDGPVGPETHEGVLAGLSWDEREEAIDEYIESRQLGPSALVSRLLDASCVAGELQTSFREFLTAHSTSSLEDLARKMGVTASSRRDGKNRLVRDIMSQTPMDARSVTVSMLLAGADTAAWVKRCVEAGGKVSFDASEIENLESFPSQAIPVFNVYHSGDTYTAIVYEEVKPALAELDLDELVERARATDEAIDYVNLAVEFRGALSVEDAIDECADVLGFEDGDDLAANLMTRSILDGMSYTLVDIYGETHLVDTCLVTLEGDGTVDDAVRRSVGKVLRSHNRRPPRPIAELVETYDSVEQWMRDVPACRSLLSYLDAHVPDGSNDHLFADTAEGEILILARSMDDAFYLSDALGVLKSLGYEPEGEERDRVCDLLRAYFDATPKWQLNGWTPEEVALEA